MLWAGPSDEEAPDAHVTKAIAKLNEALLLHRQGQLTNLETAVVYDGVARSFDGVRSALVSYGAFVREVNGKFTDLSTNACNGFALSLAERVQLARLNQYAEDDARWGKIDQLHAGGIVFRISTLKTNLARVGINVRLTNDLYVVDSVERKAPAKGGQGR